MNKKINVYLSLFLVLGFFATVTFGIGSGIYAENLNSKNNKIGDLTAKIDYLSEQLLKTSATSAVLEKSKELSYQSVAKFHILLPKGLAMAR